MCACVVSGRFSPYLGGVGPLQLLLVEGHLLLVLGSEVGQRARHHALKLHLASAVQLHQTRLVAMLSLFQFLHTHTHTHKKSKINI